MNIYIPEWLINCVFAGIISVLALQALIILGVTYYWFFVLPNLGK